MRRQLADILGLGHEAGVAWLQYAKLCRSTGAYHHSVPLHPSAKHPRSSDVYPPSPPVSTSQLPIIHTIRSALPGQPEAAATATLEAMARQAPGAVLERAKLLWQVNLGPRVVGRNLKGGHPTGSWTTH